MLLAGDAAHVHPPQGGQGLNTGVQDAVNLGWKLAQAVNGTSPEGLLATYQAERHPVAARVLRNTMAQVALGSPDDRHQALRETMTELLSMDEPRKRIAGTICGLDIRYDLGDGHVAWVGDLTDPRLPDALTTWFGPPTPGLVRGQGSTSRSGAIPGPEPVQDSCPLSTGHPFLAWRADRDRIVVVLTDDTDWEEIRELVTESYRILAPKKLAALLDSHTLAIEPGPGRRR